MSKATTSRKRTPAKKSRKRTPATKRARTAARGGTKAPPAADAPAVEAQVPSAIAAAPDAPTAVWVTVPLGVFDPAGPGYQFKRLRRPRTALNGLLMPGQSETLRSVFAALYEQRARLADGSYVESALDVVRWMLEQVAVAADGKEPTAEAAAAENAGKKGPRGQGFEG